MDSRVRAYFELLRFPAVFTAIADVMMGYLVHNGSLQPAATFAMLVIASSALYLAGMVFNDAFDAEVDAIERPERPIPSGRVDRRTAFRFGWILFAIGVGAAWTIYFRENDKGPAIVAAALAMFVYLYDWEVKKWSVGPWTMGFCRTLNVLLGMSMVGLVNRHMSHPWSTTEMLIAVGVGVYIAGVTIFSRSEAQIGKRRQLVSGILVMLAGLLMLSIAGRIELRPAHSFTEQAGWPMLWLALALLIAGRCSWAVWRLEPRATQIAVRNSLRALIVIDAAIVLGFCGPAWGCAVLALLAPMLILERWASTT